MSKKEFKNIEEISAFLTHSINTPLTYIKGNLELMYDSIEDLPSSNIKNDLIQSKKKMLKGIKKIEHVVNAVHSLTKHSSQKK